jgi:hypothetical protein
MCQSRGYAASNDPMATPISILPAAMRIAGTIVIEHPGKAAPARAAPGTDCATQESALAAQ